MHPKVKTEAGRNKCHIGIQVQPSRDSKILATYNGSNNRGSELEGCCSLHPIIHRRSVLTDLLLLGNPKEPKKGGFGSYIALSAGLYDAPPL